VPLLTRYLSAPFVENKTSRDVMIAGMTRDSIFVARSMSSPPSRQDEPPYRISIAEDSDFKGGARLKRDSDPQTRRAAKTRRRRGVDE